MAELPSYGQPIARVNLQQIIDSLAGFVVTSVSGTAGQVTVSPSPGVGAVTVSLPSGGTLPGAWHAATGFTVDAGGLTVTAGGVTVTAGNLDLDSDAGLVRLGAAQDVVLAWDAADVAALRRTTNAQALRIYNTFTDTSNYQRVNLGWATNVFEIRSTAAGTGTVRAILITAAAQVQTNIAGANVSLVAGVANGNGAGGAAVVTGGAAPGGIGGSATVAGGAVSSGNNVGGAARLTGGTGSGSGAGGIGGGDALVTGGAGGGGAAAGGAAVVTGGAAGTGNTNGGRARVTSGVNAGSGLRPLVELFARGSVPTSAVLAADHYGIRWNEPDDVVTLYVNDGGTIRALALGIVV